MALKAPLVATSNSTSVMAACQFGCMKWVGRYRVENNRINFDWPGVGVTFRVKNTSVVKVVMDGGGASFSVEIHNASANVPVIHFRLDTSFFALQRTYTLADYLSPEFEYVVKIFKRTEPRMRTLFSFSRYVAVHTFILDGPGEFLISSDAIENDEYIEIIGDSDSVGFGNEGPCTSLDAFLTMNHKSTNNLNSYGNILARMFGVRAETVAWSGKGVAHNAPFCGSQTMVPLWKRDVATASTTIPPSEQSHGSFKRNPAAVLILLGANDIIAQPPSSQEEFLDGYTELLRDVRRVRGSGTPIVCIQCTRNCQSSAGSPTTHPRDATDTLAQYGASLLQRTKYAMQSFNDPNMFFVTVDADLVCPEDFAIMMHWSTSGHQKIAHELARFFESTVFKRRPQMTAVQATRPPCGPLDTGRGAVDVCC